MYSCAFYRYMPDASHTKMCNVPGIDKIFWQEFSNSQLVSHLKSLLKFLHQDKRMLQAFIVIVD